MYLAKDRWLAQSSSPPNTLRKDGGTIKEKLTDKDDLSYSYQGKRLTALRRPRAIGA